MCVNAADFTLSATASCNANNTLRQLPHAAEGGITQAAYAAAAPAPLPATCCSSLAASSLAYVFPPYPPFAAPDSPSS